MVKILPQIRWFIFNMSEVCSVKVGIDLTWRRRITLSDSSGGQFKRRPKISKYHICIYVQLIGHFAHDILVVNILPVPFSAHFPCFLCYFYWFLRWLLKVQDRSPGSMGLTQPYPHLKWSSPSFCWWNHLLNPNACYFSLARISLNSQLLESL